MKALTIAVVALVATLVLNGPMQSYADPQLDTLVNIATQARNNLNISISQIPDVPSDITKLYDQGSAETDALTAAASSQDIASAKQHFLSAMNYFKATNDKINVLNATGTSDQQRSDVIKLQGEITRLKKLGETLRTIAITNHAGFDFTPFDTSLQQAKQELDSGNMDGASKSIDTANQLITDAHHALSEIAQERASDRAKDFTERQIERFDKMSVPNETQNTVTATNITASTTVSNSTTSVENPGEMIAKLRQLVAEGNVNEALQIIKSLDAYQRGLSANNDNVEQAAVVVSNGTNPQPLVQPEQAVTNSSGNGQGHPDRDQADRMEHKVMPQANFTMQNGTDVRMPDNVTGTNSVKTNSSGLGFNPAGGDRNSTKSDHQEPGRGVDLKHQEKAKQNDEKSKEKGHGKQNRD